jgi:hypothetical protein
MLSPGKSGRLNVGSLDHLSESKHETLRSRNVHAHEAIYIPYGMDRSTAESFLYRSCRLLRCTN